MKGQAKMMFMLGEIHSDIKGLKVDIKEIKTDVKGHSDAIHKLEVKDEQLGGKIAIMSSGVALLISAVFNGATSWSAIIQSIFGKP